jgi:hypothetical protein
LFPRVSESWLVTQNQNWDPAFHVGYLGIRLRDSMVRARGESAATFTAPATRGHETRTRISSTNNLFPVRRFIRSDRISSNAKFLDCPMPRASRVQRLLEKFISNNPARPPGVLQVRCTCMRTTTVISCVHPAGYRHCLQLASSLGHLQLWK